MCGAVTYGRFQTEYKCDNAAKKIHKKQRSDDSLFWVNTDDSGSLIVGSYVAGFFIQVGGLCVKRSCRTRITICN